MFTLNLLSLQKQRDGALRTLFLRAKTALELTLFLALIAAIIMIGTKLFLINTFLTFAGSTATNVRTRDMERSVRNVNQATALLERLSDDTTFWTPALVQLTQIVPPSVTLTEMTLNNKRTPHLALKGAAATRNDLLVFKTAIERLPFVNALNFPLTNLLAPADIQWQLDATLSFPLTQ
ncbi:MAG: hypothetical protein UY81_C0030G0006 [Candidatus Giovannonibacteria bacterium GW2011_GWA2_53_7]|uniref:Uncharacterized protein n=1 Tax=Candidatus Giovannonibacteria bacterium GW2011_GWA2_53_7 TaxID=1618650 RepID=A0A0G1XYY6_9BACT|nr:MAG: hypothetical protein UY81_C0030G0006 [Candidatus Giovannonibacteria bacterium GW2011_GWA2_53_7]